MRSRPSGLTLGPATCEALAVSQINVDARGLRCPLPVIHLAAAARDAPTGTRIIVLASDPAARYDVPAWCRMRDHELSEITEVSEPSVSEPSVSDLSVSDPSAYEPSVSDPSGKDVRPVERSGPTYLRFVVVVRAQPSKATGAGSGSDRPSRPT